jgi:hypothetical protein
MITLSAKLKRKLEKVAAAIPKLHFLGVVHRTNAPDRWDLLVSAGELTPWSLDALKSIDKCLKEVGKLSAEELVTFAQIVALPPKNEVIQTLSQNGHIQAKSLRPADRFDKYEIIFRRKKAEKAAYTPYVLTPRDCRYGAAQTDLILPASRQTARQPSNAAWCRAS